MLEKVLVIEAQLSKWSQNLPRQLQHQPWLFPIGGLRNQAVTDSLDDRLSLIQTLRFLSTRIFLHRPVLVELVKDDAWIASTASTASRSSYSNKSFLEGIALQSVTASERCASEIVDIIHATISLPVPWWVSTGFSK